MQKNKKKKKNLNFHIFYSFSFQRQIPNSEQWQVVWVGLWEKDASSMLLISCLASKNKNFQFE